MDVTAPDKSESPRETRRLALQVLFAWDAQDAASTDLANEVTLGATKDLALVQRVVQMAQKAWDARKESDAWTTRLAPQWPAHRQPGVDRAILRLAIYEMTGTDTPPKVVIDEAIELAKEFSTANSPAFVNGVLDAVMKETQALKGEPASQ